MPIRPPRSVDNPRGTQQACAAPGRGEARAGSEKATASTAWMSPPCAQSSTSRAACTRNQCFSRIYRFERGKWAELLIETVGSAAANNRSRPRPGHVAPSSSCRGLAQQQADARRAAQGQAGDTSLLEDEREPAAKRLPDRSPSE